ncbi:MAG: hypothetical protein ACFFEF_12985 [Candidatus Thorarchaeota archaeon]
MPESKQTSNRRKLGLFILFVEIAFAAASVVVAIGQGWDQVSQPLQVFVLFIIGTIFVLLYEELWNDYEEKKREHPGAYPEFKT